MINKLQIIATKPTRNIIGLMSGTSLDGLDIALCNISGSGKSTKAKISYFTTINYPIPLVTAIREISAEHISLKSLTALHTTLGNWMGNATNKALKQWGVTKDEIDLIASHGQTIYHIPGANNNNQPATLQIGDADQIAATTGITTISDFRMKHIAAGGEGAPLAGYGDYLLFSNSEKDIVLINIGGIANFTILPADEGKPICCSDMGPGNTLMDAWMRNNENLPYDKDGSIAARGIVYTPLLEKLLAHPFFKLPFPKSTGPEMFSYHWLQEGVIHSGASTLSSADIMATLNVFTARCIAQALLHNITTKNIEVFISGGGLWNLTLLKNIRELLPNYHLKSMSDTGILPDAKEALLFAILANECISGTANTFTGTGLLPVKMGKISFPL